MSSNPNLDLLNATLAVQQNQLEQMQTSLAGIPLQQTAAIANFAKSTAQVTAQIANQETAIAATQAAITAATTPQG